MADLVGFDSGPKKERIERLLKQLSTRAMFIDDFESAPVKIQEPISASNRDVTAFFRSEFLYHFGTRIIWLLSLSWRPADFAAIAREVWTRIWDRTRTRTILQGAFAYSRSEASEWRGGTKLDGNVRSLAALPKLGAAEMCEPSMDNWSQTDIIDEITTRGPDILDWVAGFGVSSTRASTVHSLELSRL